MKFEALLYVPAYTEKDFSYPLLDLLQRDLHRRITLYNLEIHNSNLHLCTLHKRKAQSLALSKEEIKLSDPMITNSVLVILKYHKQFFSQYKNPRDRFEMIAQICKKTKFLRRKHKENTWKKL